MQVPAPTKLDRLFRFYQHEEDPGPTELVWNVAGGSLEKKERLYRIYYSQSSTGVLLDFEITINIRNLNSLGLQDLVRYVVGIVDRNDLDKKFQIACVEMMQMDPWIRYLILKNDEFTKIRPLVYKSRVAYA
jgi:hypothetical protein